MCVPWRTPGCSLGCPFFMVPLLYMVSPSFSISCSGAPWHPGHMTGCLTSLHGREPTLTMGAPLQLARLGPGARSASSPCPQQGPARCLQRLVGALGGGQFVYLRGRTWLPILSGGWKGAKGKMEPHPQVPFWFVNFLVLFSFLQAPAPVNIVIVTAGPLLRIPPGCSPICPRAPGAGRGVLSQQGSREVWGTSEWAQQRWPRWSGCAVWPHLCPEGFASTSWGCGAGPAGRAAFGGRPAPAPSHLLP